MILCTLAQAKLHLRVDDPDADADVMLKLIQASEIVIDYIQRAEEGWDEFSAPPVVQAAVLLVLSELYDQREGKDGISPAVRALLERYREPVLG